MKHQKLANAQKYKFNFDFAELARRDYQRLREKGKMGLTLAFAFAVLILYLVPSIGQAMWPSILD